MFKNHSYIRISGRPHCDKTNKCPVDQFPVQEFNIAENGHPMSDIEAIYRSDSEELCKVLLQRLDVQKIKEDSRSDYEKLRDVVPRYIQTPAEVQQFIKVFHELYPAEQPLSVDEPIASVEPVDPVDPQVVPPKAVSE